ncbi:hypothetical protein [Blastomonas sp. RAC04]|uniref:hypothetical protein n=1 Tax=Blastomonas sp. RAC04 TaxID=1842535 RepID=UPI0012375359|nr:hypothetical protein [Blastomonas sp. RAC04]
MKIFWSWQNYADPKRHRHFVKGALEEAIAAIALEPDVDDAERPDIDHDVKASRGTVEIAKTIMAKIAAGAVFVADVTPIARAENNKASRTRMLWSRSVGPSTNPAARGTSMSSTPLTGSSSTTLRSMFDGAPRSQGACRFHHRGERKWQS